VLRDATAGAIVREYLMNSWNVHFWRGCGCGCVGLCADGIKRMLNSRDQAATSEFAASNYKACVSANRYAADAAVK